MKLIVCVDNFMGMTFGGKRQSRDRALAEDIIKNYGGVTADIYSQPFFAVDAPVNYVHLDDYTPSRGEYVFNELMPSSLFNNVEEIIMYHWNRDYPATTFFDIDTSGYTRTEVYDFHGTSHELITRETFVKNS